MQLEIKGFLEAVYGMRVAEVNVMNVEGKKRMLNGLTYKKSDWKKVFVTFLPFKSNS